MPIYRLKCNKCDHETETYLHNERSIATLECSECGVMGLWRKMPTTPALKKSGTYSFLEGLKK